MKTMTTLMTAALLLASLSAHAYDVDVNEFASNQSISIDNPSSDYRVDTLQLQLGNDRFMAADELMHNNSKVDYASLQSDIYSQLHESDM